VQRFGSDASVAEETPEALEEERASPRPRALSEPFIVRRIFQEGATTTTSPRNWLEEQEELLKKLIEGASFGLFKSTVRVAQKGDEDGIDSNDDEEGDEDITKKRYSCSLDDYHESDTEELRLFLEKEGIEEYFEPFLNSGNDSISKVALLDDAKLGKLGLQEIHILKLQRAVLLIFLESQGLPQFALTFLEAGYDTISKIAVLDEEMLTTLGLRKAHVLKLQRSLDGWRAGDRISNSCSRSTSQKTAISSLQGGDAKPISTNFWDGLFGGSANTNSDGVDDLRSLYEKFLSPQQSLGAPFARAEDLDLGLARSDAEKLEKLEAERQSERDFTDDEDSGSDEKSKKKLSKETVESGNPFWSTLEGALFGGFGFSSGGKK
jgi:hypothetical protein